MSRARDPDFLADILEASIRADLDRIGTPIGPFDLRIAATAVANEGILASANTRYFVRAVGLKIENWEENIPGL